MEWNSREGTITRLFTLPDEKKEFDRTFHSGTDGRSLLGVLPTFFSFSCSAPCHATNGKWSSPQVDSYTTPVQLKARTHPARSSFFSPTRWGWFLFRVRKLIIHSPYCEIICQSRWTKPKPMNSTFKGPSLGTAQPLLSQKKEDIVLTLQRSRRSWEWFESTSDLCYVFTLE